MSIPARFRQLVNRLEHRLLGSQRFYRRRGAKIGDVPVFSSPTIAEPHLCEFGDNVWVAKNCVFLNHDGSAVMLNRMGRSDVVNMVGKIVVHDNVFIGIGCTIMLDVELGPNAIVAAGSIVTRDVPPNTIVGGNPAKPICTVDDYLAKLNDEENALWIESEAHIEAEVIRYFMTEGRRGKKPIRLRRGATNWTK